MLVLLILVLSTGGRRILPDHDARQVAAVSQGTVGVLPTVSNPHLLCGI
jgi:hypothetical protein